MAESAFAVQPWLVERNGKFLQVTQLLYRIAELADGTRSIDQIAADISNSSGSEVSPELVGRMIESRLVPIGIIAADPLFHPPASTPRPASSTTRSPLMLKMRMAVISPRLINALTQFLQYLYAPIILLPLVFVMLQAQYWLLFVHGVAGGVSEALSTPGVVPIVLGLAVASAAFHEFGHAAALRYGGGTVRGMGVGFYLMYPAFYTDVTDNYRLGRWARVRTDLGGFYFNLLFSLLLMGVYHVTGREFLLLVALLTDIEILHQCLPFVRLDGYWALADLTGIPDFFSFMGAYLRSVLPIPGWKGRKLPKLKWWATAVFGVYLAVTIPMIGILLFATLRNAPRILMTAYSAILQKLAEVGQAQATGDVLGLANAEGQIALLLIPVLGLILLLVTLGRSLTVALWRWGKPTRGRRFASAFAAVAAAALLLAVWMPGLGTRATYARILDFIHAPVWASAPPITAADGGTIPQAVAAMPAALPPAPLERISLPVAVSPSTPAAEGAQATRTGGVGSGEATPGLAASAQTRSETPSAASQVTPTEHVPNTAVTRTASGSGTAASRIPQAVHTPSPAAGAAGGTAAASTTRGTKSPADTADAATADPSDAQAATPIPHATTRQDAAASNPSISPRDEATAAGLSPGPRVDGTYPARAAYQGGATERLTNPTPPSERPDGTAVASPRTAPTQSGAAEPGSDRPRSTPTADSAGPSPASGNPAPRSGSGSGTTAPAESATTKPASGPTAAPTAGPTVATGAPASSPTAPAATPTPAAAVGGPGGPPAVADRTPTAIPTRSGTSGSGISPSASPAASPAPSPASN